MTNCIGLWAWFGRVKLILKAQGTGIGQGLGGNWGQNVGIQGEELGKSGDP